MLGRKADRMQSLGGHATERTAPRSRAGPIARQAATLSRTRASDGGSSWCWRLVDRNTLWTREVRAGDSFRLLTLAGAHGFRWGSGSRGSHERRQHGWGGRRRTFEWRYHFQQPPLPQRVASPQSRHRAILHPKLHQRTNVGGSSCRCRQWTWLSVPREHSSNCQPAGMRLRWRGRREGGQDDER